MWASITNEIDLMPVAKIKRAEILQEERRK